MLKNDVDIKEQTKEYICA